MYPKFQKLLEERKLSAYRVAKDTGIPFTCLCDWKSGRSKPKLDKLLKLAEYFGVSLDYFIKE